MKRYRDAIEKPELICMSSGLDSGEYLLTSEKYAAEVADMLLYYRESRQFLIDDRKRFKHNR